MKIEKILNKLIETLPEMAKSIIKETQDLSIKENRNFLKDPDTMELQDTRWHQWGTITHTKMVMESFENEVPVFLEKWGLSDNAEEELIKEIDGITRKELLRIAIILHDIGKFKARKIKYDKDGSKFAIYTNHEKYSGEFIRKNNFKTKLKEEFGLTLNQIEYIAKAAELHFELGILREKGKSTSEGFTRKFLKTSLFEVSVREIILSNPDFKWEIGLLYLTDTLGKMDIKIYDNNNEEEIREAREEIERRGLDKKLLMGVLQFPINLAVAEKYLSFCEKIKK